MSTLSYILSDITGFNDMIKSSDNNLNVLKLNKVECRTSNSTYKIIRYDKNFLNIDLVSSYGLCRSVIINSKNDVVGFAPPKSISAELFIQKYNNETEYFSSISAQEFIEGTMINVFWDDSIGLTGAWEIATRNTVGATSKFYKGTDSKTFRNMFLEAAAYNNLVLDSLDKTKCYSFVLQHPENRIVVSFKHPQLYLVAVYQIKNIFDRVTVDILDAQDFTEFFTSVNSTVMFPKLYQFEKYTDLIEKYASMNTSYDVVGVVLYNKLTGERSKIRNPVYEQVRNLRGNQPKLQYQYLCLRKEGKVSDFLKFYPENKKEFSSFRDSVHLFTNTLYSNYTSCYIKKEKPLKEYSEQYRTHMFNIHKIFLDQLREKKQFVTNTVVINYVNDMHPSLLMYCLNFHMRKRSVDTIVADNSV
jgi:hypothetical protein